MEHLVLAESKVFYVKNVSSSHVSAPVLDLTVVHD